MSVPDVLPLDFDLGDKTYPLACPDHELELYFQARHEAWARNRIEAAAGLVGERAHRTDVEVFASQRASNRFAFGGPLSMAFVLSDEGMAEYLLLLSQKGQKEKGGGAFSKASLRQLKRETPAEWDRLVGLVLGRDFPNVMAGTGPSPAPETPTSTTSGSSSSSAESPGGSPRTKSSE